MRTPSVRTIASRWNNGKDNVEAFGWSLGVTGEKSRFKPRNLIIQLVGEDENRNIAYEPVASESALELGVDYHVAAKVSCSDAHRHFPRAAGRQARRARAARPWRRIACAAA